jgi:hypothetical protein
MRVLQTILSYAARIGRSHACLSLCDYNLSIIHQHEQRQHYIFIIIVVFILICILPSSII